MIVKVLVNNNGTAQPNHKNKCNLVDELSGVCANGCLDAPINDNDTIDNINC